MVEQWKEIEGFPGYYISSFGRVRHDKKYTKILKLYEIKGGGKYKKEDVYLGVTLYKDKKKVTKKVHRLVAEYFIPTDLKITPRLFVNHKDLNKLNNYADNLEWMYCRENTVHYFEHRKFRESDEIELMREKAQEVIK